MAGDLQPVEWSDLHDADPADRARRLAALAPAARREAEELLALAGRLHATLRPVTPPPHVLSVPVFVLPTPKPAPRFALLRRRRVWVVAALAGGALASLGGVVAYVWRQRQRRPAPALAA